MEKFIGKKLLGKNFRRKISRKIDDQSLAVLNIFSKFLKYWLNRRQINLNEPKKCFDNLIWRNFGALPMQNLLKSGVLSRITENKLE